MLSYSISHCTTIYSYPKCCHTQSVTVPLSIAILNVAITPSVTVPLSIAIQNVVITPSVTVLLSIAI